MEYVLDKDALHVRILTYVACQLECFPRNWYVALERDV